MKLIAVILSSFMLLLSVETLLLNPGASDRAVAMECCSDQCSCCGESENDHQDKTVPCDSDQECAPDCDCSSRFQITALAYAYSEVSGVIVNTYHYIRYTNTYSFEFSHSFLHPPRLV